MLLMIYLLEILNGHLIRITVMKKQSLKYQLIPGWICHRETAELVC